MDLDIKNTEWDCCVVGNGVSALWMSHWLRSSKKSVLWITSEQPYSSERAMLQHAWLWGLGQENSSILLQQLQGFEPTESLPGFEVIYYDSRSSKRFRKFGEIKQDWGSHEEAYFQGLAKIATDPNARDLWQWHSKLYSFHSSGENQNGPTSMELFSDPRFVRVQGLPVLELKTSDGKISSVVLAGTTPEESTEVTAKSFYLGEFDEYLPTLIKDEKDSQLLAGVLKGRSYRAGFGLKLWHKELSQSPTQTAIVPLVANPSEKGAGSHVVGRFEQGEQGLESFWIGLLTDDEVEDNNEILKKIKLAKRAIDRAIPGFADSIEREAVTFEPRMRAVDLVKNRKFEALGAVLLSDHYGPEVTAESARRIFTGSKTSKVERRKPSAEPEQAL